MLALGFSAGLPLLLVLGTLSFWLREAGIDRTTIGYLSWVGLAYAFKWVWAPLVDRLPLPGLTRRLGRRRSWLLLSQGLVMAGLVGMAFNDPQLALAENAYPNMGKQRWEIGMAVHESNRQLAYAVEEALEGLIREGSVKTIYGHYGLRYDVPGMYQ